MDSGSKTVGTAANSQVLYLSEVHLRQDVSEKMQQRAMHSRTRCGRKTRHSDKLHVHHKVSRSQGGSDAPIHLITLCKHCHEDLQRGLFDLKKQQSKTKHATEVSSVNSTLKQQWGFAETFGYETKFKREQILGLPKTHHFDAVVICCEDDESVSPATTVYQRRHVAAGDYQQTKGSQSEKPIPTGRLFGLHKFDLVHTAKDTGFVKGESSSGVFALMDITGKVLTASVSVKKNVVRVSARTSTLKQTMEAAILPGTEVPGPLAVNT
jgi:hypothetical protein